MDIIGIDEHDKSEIIVYPNPVKDIISFVGEHLTTAQVGFELMDLTGRRVLYFPLLNRNFIPIKKSEVPSGIYIYRFLDGVRPIQTGKIVVNN